MSAFIFFQESVQLSIPVWQGLTGLGVVTSIGVALHNINNSKLNKKVDKNVFEEHKKSDDQAHSYLKDKVDSIDDKLDLLIGNEIKKK